MQPGCQSQREQRAWFWRHIQKVTDIVGFECLNVQLVEHFVQRLEHGSCTRHITYCHPRQSALGRDLMVIETLG